MITVKHRRLLSAIIFSFVFIPLVALSQVKIKEKVEITPQQSSRPVKLAEVRVLKVIASFSGMINDTFPSLIYVNGPCNITAGDPGASGSLSVAAYEGIYHAGYRFTTYTGGQFSFTVLLGDVKLVDIHTSLDAHVTAMSQNDVPLCSGLAVSAAYDAIGLSATNYFSAAVVTSDTACAMATWSPSLDIQLEITKGGDIGEFLDRNGQPVGNKTAMSVDDPWYTPTFLADGTRPYGDVEVTVTSGGVSMVRAFKVLPPAPQVYINPPWISLWPIKVNFANLPVLDFGESHYPYPGDPFEPTITWDTTSSIHTADYYDRITDTLSFYVRVKAVNPGGVAVDSSLVTLIKECIKVTFSPPKLSPGGIADLSFQWVNPDGSPEDIPGGQYDFSALIINGGDSSKGLLVSGSDTATTLLHRSYIRYIAPPKINGTQLEVQVAGAATATGGGDASIRKPVEPIRVNQRFLTKSIKKRADNAAASQNLADNKKPVQAVLTDAMRKVALQVSWCPTSTVVVETQSFFGFKISLNRDSLKNHDVAIVTLVAIDSDSNEVQIDPLTPINLDFEELGQFVDFITVTGDTVDVLSNVPYGDFRAGKFKVVARGTQTGPVIASSPIKSKARIGNAMYQDVRRDLPQAKVKAVAVADATKIGSRNIVLKPEIKVIVVADSIKPNYPNRPDLIPAADSHTAVKVVVTLSGLLYQLSVPYGVTISSFADEGSGGHSHIGNRPTGRFIEDNVGQLTLQKQTGSDTIRATYQASLFGGKERIIATISNITPVIADTDSVVVRVPGLVPFGGTGDYRWGRLRTDHPENHYLENQNAIDDLIAAANEFHRANWNTAGIMRLNDMSLQFGGLLDIHSNWQTPHNAHRLGKSVDIENIIIRDTTGTFTRGAKQVTGTFRVANGDWLNKFIGFMSRHYWTFVPEGQTVPDSSVKYPHFKRQGE